MLKQLDNWLLKEKDGEQTLSIEVPGDITKALYDAGKIEDPFFGLNHLKLKEQVLDKDYIYKTEFTLDRLHIVIIFRPTMIGYPNYKNE